MVSGLGANPKLTLALALALALSLTRQAGVAAERLEQRHDARRRVVPARVRVGAWVRVGVRVTDRVRVSVTDRVRVGVRVRVCLSKKIAR